MLIFSFCFGLFALEELFKLFVFWVLSLNKRRIKSKTSDLISLNNVVFSKNKRIFKNFPFLFN